MQKSYGNRKVAAMLKDTGSIYQPVMGLKYSCEYEIYIENLNMKKDLVAKRDSLFNSIKDGEEALPHVRVGLDNFDTIVALG